MKLFLKNIGKVNEASVEINGITIIAGENDTGKSTVGRALFSVFNGFYNIKVLIETERAKSIENAVKRICEAESNFFVSHRRKLTNKIIESFEIYKNDIEFLRTEVMDLISQYDKKFKDTLDLEDIDELVSHIYEILNISDDEMMKAVVGKKFYEEFGGQISNIFNGRKGEIQLSIKNKGLKINIENNEIINIQNSTSFNSEVVYIDDPFIIDDMIPMIYYQNFNYLDHHMHLRNQLSKFNTNERILDEIITKNKLERILKLISTACSGDIVQNNHSIFEYKEADSDNTLMVKNLSTGLKTFAILKKLLLNGSLKSKSTIIFDEPEIHLHPEWQLLFAEIIVLLQKDFDLHILLNTHSPYFLRAIQVYSAKYDIADRCKYYLSEVNNNQAYINDVTDDVEQIYSKLAYPLQKLENERWQG